jgi:hypothetical protein
MYKAEQLNLFEIEPEDSLAVYGTPDIPFLVVTSTTSTLIKTENLSLNMWSPFGSSASFSTSTPAPLPSQS